MSVSGTIKKVKRIIHEKVLGNAIVVTPELVPNVNWDWKGQDSINDAMAVSSETFYNYLGHYISPRESLTIGPFENDLTQSIDNAKVGSPSIFPFNTEIVETNARILKYIGSSDISSDDMKPKHIANTLIRYDVESSSDIFPQSVGDYAGDIKNQELYSWDGEWGSFTEKFQTGVELELKITVVNDKGRGDVPNGASNNTKADMNFWVGDSADKVVGANTFYNPHFSTGRLKYGNGQSKTDTFSINITRKPYETSLLYVVDGRFEGNERGKPDRPDFDSGLSGPAIVKALVKSIKLLFETIFKIIMDFLFMIIGQTYSEKYHSTVWVELREKRTYYSKFNAEDIENHPANTFFVNNTMTAFPLSSYIYTQFHYPYFDLNRFKVYGKEYYYKFPYMQNELITGTSSASSREFKTHRYFVPNLFRLLFETNIGVFYEFLLKQMNPSDTPAIYNFNTKILPEDNTQIEDEEYRISKQRKTIYDVIFPTDETFFNNVIENGLGTETCYDTSSFLYNIFSTTDVNKINPYSDQFNHTEYNDVYGKYPIGDKLANGSAASAIKTRIQEINEIIGDFSTIKGILETDDGYSLTDWTERCNDPSQHIGLADLLDLTNVDMVGGVATYGGNYPMYRFDPANAPNSVIPSSYSDLLNDGQTYNVRMNPSFPNSPEYWTAWENSVSGYLDLGNDSDNDLNDFLDDAKNNPQSASLSFSDLTEIEPATFTYDGVIYKFVNNAWEVDFSSGSQTPKNLSYKIIQFILWYMQPNGIADQTRLITRSLFEYEKLIDQDIDNFDSTTYNEVANDPTRSNNPIIIGDTIYERKCP